MLKYSIRFFNNFDNNKSLSASGEIIGILGKNPSSAPAQSAAWNHALRVLGIEVSYLPFDLDNPDHLPRIIAELESTPQLIGLKIAPPYKEHVFKYLSDRVEGAARSLRVVNTVAKRGGRLVAANTDGAGMAQHLREAFGPLTGKRFLLIGAGGAAAGIADALRDEASGIVIAARSEDKARRLRDFLELKSAETTALDAVERVIAGVDCVINTTPVGRSGPLEAFSALVSTALSAGENEARSESILSRIPRSIAFASTLYLPEKELLLRQAQARGHRVVNGLGMWLYQAALAAKELFFPERLAGVPLPRIAAALGEGLEAHAAR